MKKYLLFITCIALTMCLTSCSLISSAVEDSAIYERDASRDQKYCELIGKTYALQKDIYLYQLAGCPYPSLSRGPDFEVMYTPDGSRIKYSGSPSCQLLEMVRKGTHFRIVKILVRGCHLKPNSEHIEHIYVQFQGNSGECVTAEAEALFAYPSCLLKPQIRKRCTLGN